MNVSECIQPSHLSRLAIVYIRQSTPQQILNNQESLKLQYDLAQRAGAFGWDPKQIRVIDADLGRSGRTSAGRPGFQELTTLVSLEQVGIVFAYDVTRLARNCTDWYQLLDLCGCCLCLVGDQDGVYDPSTPNGRLILGLKGLISELELHTLRRRMLDGLLNKARRGELAQRLPIGLVRESSGQVVKHPNQEVQGRLDLVFTTCLRLRSARQVTRHFQTQQLLVPRRDHWGELVWQPATEPRICSILNNPAYAGAFVRGRTKTMPGSASAGKPLRKRLPLAEWPIRVADRYPAYIDWETFLRIQTMLRDNHSDYVRNHSRGVPRCGAALLAGIITCGECGHKMTVKYQNQRARYRCEFLHKRHRTPVCQNLPAAPLDDHVVGAFLEALAPVELDLYARALAAFQHDDAQLRQARQQQLERLRYQARLAERQFQQADPDNRLVAAELEKRWEIALRDVKDAEEAWQRDQHQQAAPAALDAEKRKALEKAGQKVSELWRQDLLSPQQRKALVRCLIDKVVAQRSAPDTVRLRIVWKGGDTSTATVAVPVASLARLSSAKEFEAAIIRLARQGENDTEIAAILTREGLRSPRGPVVLPTTVRLVRLRQRLLLAGGQSRPRSVCGHRTVSELARQLHIQPQWIYDRIRNGTIAIARDPECNLYLFPDEPKTITLFKQLRAGKLKNLLF